MWEQLDFGSNLVWFAIHKVLNVNHTTPTEKFLSVSECLPVRLKHVTQTLSSWNFPTVD